MMQMFGIGEIARRAGVATSTIRYYERIGLLPPSRRVNTKRRYDTSILQKLNVIHMGQNADLTIAEIQTLLHEFPVDTPPSERWQALAVKKIADLDELMNRVQAMKSLLEQTLQCDCSTIDDCASVEENADTGEIEIKAGCGTAAAENIQILTSIAVTPETSIYPISP